MPVEMSMAVEGVLYALGLSFGFLTVVASMVFKDPINRYSITFLASDIVVLFLLS